MKRIWISVLACVLVISPHVAVFARNYDGDLSLSASNVRFSTATFLEGKTVRAYATVGNSTGKDLLGVVKFFDNKKEIKGDQPVSALAGKDDSVFVDWMPGVGDHELKIVLVPYDPSGDDPSNNEVNKTIRVLADTDRDGIPNINDPDDDNDGVFDALDAFPLDKSEQYDTDGDGIGNNKDDDDDNDGVKDKDDAFPLDHSEWKDSDHDAIGDNADPDDDNEGIPDVQEVAMGTNPLKADTDDDDVNDKQDVFSLDPTEWNDYDNDSIGDNKDPDADNDGIPKGKDVNDTNLGPVIVVTSNGASPNRITTPGAEVSFEVNKSYDPDGKISSIEWEVAGGKKYTGEVLATSFAATGAQPVSVTLKDDKGEPRTTSFKIYVVPTFLPWLLISLILLILILALFWIFSYTKRRYENSHPPKVLRKRNH